MRKNILATSFVLAIISTMIIPSCVVRRSEPIVGNMFAPVDQLAIEGETIYMAKCQKCHPGGEGGLGPSINGLPGFLKPVQIRHGLGVMPAFKQDDLPKDELKKVRIYMREWQKY